MGGMILILAFAALVGFLGFYIITRKTLKGYSRKTVLGLSLLVTVLFVGLLAALLAGL